jgi:tetratricopeptide (TPR) repeat protein
LTAVKQVDGSALPGDARARLDTLTQDIEASAAAAQADQELIAKLTDIRSAATDDRDGSAGDAAYADVFRAAGIDVDVLGHEEAGAKIRSRPESVALALAAALDDWASRRRKAKPKDTAAWQKIIAAARVADPDAFRAEMRGLWEHPDLKAQRQPLRALAEKVNAETWPVQTLNLLALALLQSGDNDAAVALLRRAVERHPRDVWTNYRLAELLLRIRPPRRDEAIRYFTAARALQPETGHPLAHLLGDRGDTDEAIQIYRDLARLRPNDGRHLGCLGELFLKLRRTEESRAAFDKAVAIERETIELRPDDFSAHHNLGRVLLLQERYDEGIAECLEAIRLRPNECSAHSNLARAFLLSGWFDEAVEACRKAIELLPDEPVLRCRLGEALSGLGQIDASLAAFREAIRLDPEHLDGYLGLGAVLCDIKMDYTAAEAVFREAIRLAPDDTTAHNNQSTALGGQGRHEEAIAESREAIRLDPYGFYAHTGLGLSLHALGRTEEGIAELREAIRLKPNHYRAHASLGVMLYSQERLDEGIAEIREAIRFKPDEAGLHQELGRALAMQGQIDDAIQELHLAIHLQPDDPSFHNTLGAIFCDNKHDYPAAEAEFRRAIQLQPDFVEAHVNLGNALRGLGRPDEAIAAFREAIRLQPDHASAHIRLGAILCDVKHDFPAAEAAFREAIRLQPENPVAHKNLGWTLIKLGRFDAAITELHEALRLKPDFASARHCLGVTLMDLGKHDEAILVYRELIRLYPNDAGAFYHLGLCLKAKGTPDDAAAAYREAIRLDPEYAEAHCNLASILQSQANYAEALAEYRRGHELGSKRPDWRYPSAEWVRQAEKLAALADRLPAILSGDDQPKDGDERLILSHMCYQASRYAAAARLWAEAHESDPDHADDLQDGHRYNAACAAALAGCGMGEDDPPPDDAARTTLRRQALAWLKADLALRSKQSETNAAEAHKALAHWKRDSDLAGVREPDALQALPEDERNEWNALWAKVDRLLEDGAKSP